MGAVKFKNRRAVQIENDIFRVTVLEEGGHIAEIFDKRANVSPLWIPKWDSLEPSSYSLDRSEEFGTGPDAKLLAGIMGHNVCLDIFGVPSPEEERLGLTVHGEASVDPYEISEGGARLTQNVTLRLAQLKYTRKIELKSKGLRIRELVENLCGVDRPIAWTQHVTLGPPFLHPATTDFRASMTRSVVSDSDPGLNAYLRLGEEFAWPSAPRSDGGRADLQRMYAFAPASSYTAHLADPSREHAFFITFSPHYQLAFGYIWKRNDFPWMGIWEENSSRQAPPWKGREVTRGMEFGVSPFPESRRAMVDRNQLLGVPSFRWIGAGETIEVEYWIVSEPAGAIPESLGWPDDAT